MKRLRLLGVTLIPNFVLDDGDDLAHLKIEPMHITAKQWGDVVNIFANAVAELRQTIEKD